MVAGSGLVVAGVCWCRKVVTGVHWSRKSGRWCLLVQEKWSLVQEVGRWCRTGSCWCRTGNRWCRNVVASAGLAAAGAELVNAAAGKSPVQG